MKKGHAIFFAIVLLLRGVDFLIDGLAMLPYLKGHFHTHREHFRHDHGEELPFFDFFWQHYGNLNHHDDDGGDHSNIPFSHPVKGCLDFEITPLKSIHMHGVFWGEDGKSKAELALNSFYSRLYIRDIFRPPLF